MKRLLLVSTLVLAACSSTTAPNDSGSGNDSGSNGDVQNVVDSGNGGTDAGMTGTDVQNPVDSGNGGTDAGMIGTDAGMTGTDAGPTTSQITVDMPSVDLQAGEETTMCSTFRLGNPAGGLITHVHVHLAPGSHHLIFYRSRDTTESRTPQPCQALGGVINGSSPLIIAQATDSDLEMPNNVGMAIAGNQMVKIEEHFINLTGAPIQGTGTVTVDLTTQTAGLTRAEMMFWGTQQISVPPHATGSAEHYWPVTSNIHIFGLTTHEHMHGTTANIDRATSATDPGSTLYMNNNWAEPPLEQFMPPIDFTGSGDGLRLHCDYNNTTDQTLTFGESANDEMCFFWAFYYPSHGFDACFDDQCAVLP